MGEVAMYESVGKKKSRFDTFETTSPGKLDTIEYQNWLRSTIYRDTHFDGYGVSLPGNGQQLARHRDELEGYGIREEKQVMVEHCPYVYESLRQEARNIDFKGEIVFGELNDVVNRLWKEGKQIDVIDFDDVGYLQEYHCNLITEAAKKDVKWFILVLTNRGARDWTWYLNMWREQLGIPDKVWQQRRMQNRKPWQQVQEGAIRSVSRACNLNLRTKIYQGYGHTPMESFIMWPKNFT